MSPIISCRSISKWYGSKKLFENISFSVFDGDRLGIIGPNGSGKSTLLKILASQETPDNGEVVLKKGLKVGYVPQASMYPDEAIEDYLMKCFDSTQKLADYEKYTLIAILLGKLGFTNPKQSANTLSGGWKKRLDIAKELIKEPDVLLLDEPTNHLDIDGVLWLEEFLSREKLTYLLISHDRTFLQHTTNHVMELNFSYPKGFFMVDGPYATFLEKREAFLAGQMQYERALASKLRREIDWLRRGPKARTTKAQSRVQEAHRLIQEHQEVKSRNKKISSQIDFTSSQTQTRKLISVKNVSKSLGNKNLFSSVEFVLSPGTRLGLIGANGSGKTTLLKLLAGEISPDIGTIKWAEGLKIVYFDQHRCKIPLDITVREALGEGKEFVQYHGQSIHVNGWAKKFLFPSERLELPVGKLSGGERARLHLARLILQPADVLLLDEPTNDLDIPTLEILEDSLQEFEGAIVLITHDRFLLDQVTTSVLSLGYGPQCEMYADYAQWQENQELQAKTAKNASPVEKKQDLLPFSSSKPKLSYYEKRELESMEEKIVSLENQIKDIEEQLQNPAVATDFSQLQQLGSELHSKQNELEKLFIRWEELEKKKS